ncbi:hypothetical protein PAL_GLEAN10010247 [Pteropus alecto]|uniref:Uncharacterized protein n=1 Tax=Pteropus alecto TaxID=9402 RepID=L5JZD6_PTEAL|nr:hypothetical protein PAL_GLEAN10010247 [Pteropus alecto]
MSPLYTDGSLLEGEAYAHAQYGEVWIQDPSGCQEGKTARKKKRNKTPVLTHNLVRFGSRTLVGAKKAADIYDR